MKERSFLDTNILIYTDDAADPRKQAIALQLLEAGWNSQNAVISTQVLQEYFSAATKKIGIPVTDARRKVELLGRLDVVSITHSDILQSIDLHRLHALSFWDALIVQMAQQSGCRVLYSEDMHNGLQLGELKIINPFATA